MTRARDMANLGSQAGSGLDASDITTGTLGNTVQDNVTRLGTVTAGTLGSGIVFDDAHKDIDVDADSWVVYLAANLSFSSAVIGWTTHKLGTNGVSNSSGVIQVGKAGWYFVTLNNSSITCF